MKPKVELIIPWYFYLNKTNKTIMLYTTSSVSVRAGVIERFLGD